MGVLEAMAHGIPTIATPVGGVPQIIDDGANGFIMPVDDERVLKEKMLRLLGDASLRAAIGIAGRDTVKEGFNTSRCVDNLVGLYEEAFDGNR